MGSFACQQRPGPPDSGTIKRRSILMFPVAIAVVAIPAGALWQFHPQQRVDHFDRIQDAGIIGRSQTEAHERERIGADHMNRRLPALPRWTGFYGNESYGRR